MAGPLTIAFADDHPLLLRGIMNLFEDDPAYSVIGKADCANTALDLVRNHVPDVIVMDLSMPGDIFQTISEMAAQFPTRIVIFTAYSSIDAALKALEAGAVGFVLKDSDSEELFDAVSAVSAGEMYITKQFALQVMNGLRERSKRDSSKGKVKLSPRELQIARLLAQARTNREIADALEISEQTVKSYMSALMAKLKARNRVEVAMAAHKYVEAESPDLLSRDLPQVIKR